MYRVKLQTGVLLIEITQTRWKQTQHSDSTAINQL